MRILSCLLLLLPFVACDDGASPAPPIVDAGPIIDMRIEVDSVVPMPDAAPPDCEDERRRCTDDGVEVCVEGQWRGLGPCNDGTVCEGGECVIEACEPDCNGRICGDDGCGSQCGECDAGWTCSMEGRCDPPAPRCGDDACNGDEDCSTCPADCGSCCGDGTCADAQGETCATCLADCACDGGARCDAEGGTCEACQPQCDGRACGEDGCGGTCGNCPDMAACDNGVCAVMCMPVCDGRSCGPDGCGGQCGDCDDDQVCSAQGQCEAPPERCGDAVCGDGEDCGNCPADCGVCCGDGQCVGGETCSTCPADCGCPEGEQCNVQQARCIDECVPQCDGRNCGADGCGGTCGNCLASQDCNDGVCRDRCVADCDGRVCGGDGCGGSCGDCDAGDLCDDGICAEICTPECAGRACGDDGCGGFCGACDVGEVCTEAGLCDAVCERDCDGRQCGTDGCGGSCGDCRDGEDCAPGGQCVVECVPECDDRACGDDGCGGECGVCAMGAICADGGVCIGGEGFCDCADEDVCLDGVCRGPEQLCDADTPNGLCPSGRACVAGICEANGAGCSPANPTGICPLGEVCRDGGCEAFDGSVLCDDDNACTRDLYDHQANRCVNAPVGGACDDGNTCTANQCDAGVCVADPLPGCIEPPRVDPVDSPTNDGDLALSGDKPAGASIFINGAEAVPESPDEAWTIDLQLQPGENVFEIRSNDMGAQSGVVTVRVVYDIVPPELQITPSGGTFLDAVTVQVTTNEPATVYYTDDGGTPDRWSKSFRSVKRLRVFNDTHFRFRAVDAAGNWQADVTDAVFHITGENNRWVEALPLPEAVSLAAVSVQNSRRVHVIGGTDGLAAQAGVWTMETLGENAGVWEAAPALPLGRTQATAVAVGTTTYVFGGENDGIPLNFTQRLTNGADAWQNLAPMPTTRFGAAAATDNTRIFVFGGKTNGGAVLPNLEVYTPNTNSWSNMVAQMPRARYGHQAVFHDGLIYVLGGEDEAGTPIAEVDVYNPSADRWTLVPAMPTPRAFATASLDRNLGAVDGHRIGIVVAGGRIAGGAPSAVVEQYSITDNVWRSRTPLRAPRHSAVGVATSWTGGLDLANNHTLVIGGLEAEAITADVRGLVVEQDYARTHVDLPEGRFAHAAVEHNGSFFIFGGRNFQGTQLFWQYDPETGRTTDLPELPTLQNGVAGVVHDGLIYAIGGANQFNLAVPTLRAYDPATQRWTELAPMQTGRADMAVAVLNDEIWTIGGDNNGPLPSVEIYSPASNEWRAGPVLPEGRSGARAINHDGEIKLFGGTLPDGDLHENWLTLSGGQWVIRGALPTISHAQIVAVHDNQAVILGGRDVAGPTKTIVAFDLQTGRLARALTPSTVLTPAVDRAVALSHHGRIWILGGNATVDIGPEGSAAVHSAFTSCFNGVLDTGEEPGQGGAPDANGPCGRHAPLIDGDARIVGNTLNSEGLLEIYHNGRWGIVCDDAFDQNEVRVVCNEVFGVSNGSFRNRNSGRTDFWLDDLACGGNEARLSECGNRGWGSHNCGSTETVYVTCRP